MAGKQEAKPLSFKAIEMMKPGDKDNVDIGENRDYVSPDVRYVSRPGRSCAFSSLSGSCHNFFAIRGT